MTLQKYSFKSGINKENTRYTNEGGWWDMQWARFRSGTPEKMGGWIKYTQNPFIGVCRAMFNWVDLDNDDLMALGTHLKLEMERGGQVFDITPVTTSYTGANPIATVDESSIVTVTCTAHRASIGSYITIVGAAAVNGIPADVLNNEDGWPIVSIIDPNTLTIDVGVQANATGSGGGAAVTVWVLLENGTETASGGTGWGAGGWGGLTDSNPTTLLNGAINDTVTTITVDSTDGFPTSGSLLIDAESITYTGTTSTTFTGCTRGVGNAAASHADNALVQQAVGWGIGANTSAVSTIQLRLWSFDNFGENLLANVRGGQIYYWEPSAGYTYLNRAFPISSLPGASQTPLMANVVISTDDRHVVAFGTNPLGSSTQDPLLIRWSNQEDPADWDITTANTAGDLRVSMGSQIVAVTQTRQETLVWTDVSLHSLQYVGAPYTFSLQTLGSNLSIISPNAVVTVNNITYWMGKDKFYAYSGRVETLPCSLRRYVFSDINQAQGLQVQVGVNEQYGEIMWFYCSAEASRIDKYVVFNYLENIWYYGMLSRTSWLDSKIRSKPLAVSYDGYMYQHEVGCDDGSVNPPVAIPSYIESADFDIDDGDKFSFIKRIIPDIDFQNSTASNPSVVYTLKARNFPGSSFDVGDARIIERTTSAIVDNYTNQVWTRVRGRQAAIRIESSGLGVMWQIGTTRFDLRPDGRR